MRHSLLVFDVIVMNAVLADIVMLFLFVSTVGQMCRMFVTCHDCVS